MYSMDSSLMSDIIEIVAYTKMILTLKLKIDII